MKKSILVQNLRISFHLVNCITYLIYGTQALDELLSHSNEGLLLLLLLLLLLSSSSFYHYYIKGKPGKVKKKITAE